MPEDRRRRRAVLSRYVLRFEPPAGLWGPCRLQQLAAPTDPIRRVKRLRPCSSPSPPTARASWRTSWSRAVADAGDGSSGIYEDSTRRGRCLNCEILSNFFCSAPRSISQGTSRCDPLHRGGAAAKVPPRHPFVPSHETPGLRNQAASYGGAMQEVDDVPSSNCATRLSA
jgi:hypothetical protein